MSQRPTAEGSNPKGSARAAQPLPQPNRYDSSDEEDRRRQMHNECKRISNMQGMKSTALAIGGLVATNWALNTYMPRYRKFDVLGKIIIGSTLAYSVFYLRSFQAEKQCVERSGHDIALEGAMLLGLPSREKDEPIATKRWMRRQEQKEIESSVPTKYQGTR